jgi:calcium-dependent protein kinase
MSLTSHILISLFPPFPTGRGSPQVAARRAGQAHGCTCWIAGECGPRRLSIPSSHHPPSPTLTPTPPPHPKPKNPTQNTTPQDVTAVYTLGRVLGRGQFGTTRLANEKSTGAELACKSIAKRKLATPEDVEDVQREVQIMHHLKGSPAIVTLKGAYEDKHNVHLVMELCSGGELFDRIVAKGHLSEADAARLMRTIVSVVAHCHSLGVIHRDLKPENFLLDSPADDAQLKATDFGLSVFYKPGDVFTDIVGSAYYVAPEVLRRSYGPQADIWSCGVILYILLSGVPPFWGETEQQIFDAVLKGDLDLTSDPWPSISESARDCVRRMLVQDPKARATAGEVLQHEWMRENGTARDEPLDNVVLSRLRGFAGMNKLKKEAMKVIAGGMSPEEIAGLRTIFEEIDADGSGTITVDELKAAMAKRGSSVARAEMEALLSNIDLDATGALIFFGWDGEGGMDGCERAPARRRLPTPPYTRQPADGAWSPAAAPPPPTAGPRVAALSLPHPPLTPPTFPTPPTRTPGTLDYHEFLAATLHQSQLDKEENMARAFAAFDTDGSGMITKDELAAGLAAAGVTAAEIDCIVAEADTDGDGLIDYDEFCVMMRAKDKPAPALRKGAVP